MLSTVNLCLKDQQERSLYVDEIKEIYKTGKQILNNSILVWVNLSNTYFETKGNQEVIFLFLV